MQNRWSSVSAFLVAWSFLAVNVGQAQQATPEMIVYNGKIVTMSDKSFTSNVGTVAQAMAIRDDNVVAVGTNAQIRGQAGPNTKQIDLEGRTVVPGLIVVHDHPYDLGATESVCIEEGTDG